MSSTSPPLEDGHRTLASTAVETTAPYSIWVKLDKGEMGEMGVIDAILSPHYKFEGQKLKVLKNIRVFHRVNELSSEIEKVY